VEEEEEGHLLLAEGSFFTLCQVNLWPILPSTATEVVSTSTAAMKKLKRGTTPPTRR